MSNATGTVTLAEFLLARIAEDEEVAREAGGGTWHIADGYRKDIVDAAANVVVYDEGNPSPGQAEHIARHDPARVLAECESKRRIVEPLTLPEPAIGGGPGWFPEAAAAIRERRATLEEVARTLAAAYADHPDYDQAWA